MESLITYYLGSIAAIAMVMEIIVKVDKAMDSWSLSKVFNVLGFEFTLLNVVGAVMSIGASIWLTVAGGYGFVEFIVGSIAIYFTQYGAGKLGWRKVVKFIMTITGKAKE